jgi:hypothetical protein
MSGGHLRLFAAGLMSLFDGGWILRAPPCRGLAGRGYAERRESLLCELNCGLTGMARQFSELSVIPNGVAALPNSRS